MRPKGYSKLVVEKVGARRWAVCEHWRTPHATVRDCFTSDGATVPRLLWWFIAPAGVFFEASVLHDWMLYDRRYSAAQAHYAFKLAALDYGAPKWKVTIAYWAIRIYGALTYDNKSRSVR